MPGTPHRIHNYLATAPADSAGTFTVPERAVRSVVPRRWRALARPSAHVGTITLKPRTILPPPHWVTHWAPYRPDTFVSLCSHRLHNPFRVALLSPACAVGHSLAIRMRNVCGCPGITERKRRHVTHDDTIYYLLCTLKYSRDTLSRTRRNATICGLKRA